MKRISKVEESQNDEPWSTKKTKDEESQALRKSNEKSLGEGDETSRQNHKKLKMV